MVPATSASIILLFIIAAAVAVAAKRLRVPYTVALVVAGLALGTARVLAPPILTKELLFTLFLPGLLFEAAFHLEAEEFWRNRLPIFSLALPGVALATLFTAVGLMVAVAWTGIAPGLTWGPAFIFATLIAATDPIAVVALVRTLGAPSRLAVLIEGESLLNDGTAAVAFTVATAYVLGNSPTTASLLVDFAYSIGGGVIIGGTIGIVTARMMSWLDDAMLVITVTTTAAYGAFVAGEALQASGVIATVTAGLLCGNKSSQAAVSASSRAAVRTFWEYVAFALNSLVFLLIGFQVRIGALVDAWPLIVITFIVVTLVRTIVTYGLNAALPITERLPNRWTAVLSWSGLRGSLAMVLALSLPTTMAGRDLVVTMTIGVVVLSIIVQGLTVAPLLRRLRIVARGDSRSAYELVRARLMAARAAEEELSAMASMHVTAPDVRGRLEEEYKARIELEEERLRGLQDATIAILPDELDRVRRHLLSVERDHIQDAYRMGVIGDDVRDRLLADIDARWRQSELAAAEERSSLPPTTLPLQTGEISAMGPIIRSGPPLGRE